MRCVGAVTQRADILFELRGVAGVRGVHEVLRWMKGARPLALARTFIVSDEGGRDWMEELLRSIGVHGVEVVTPDEVPESLRGR